MAFVTADGLAKPEDPEFRGQFYPSFGRHIPALRSFYFAFNPDPRPRDHEINHMHVLVGGPSLDLSPPGAQNAPVNLPDGRLDVAITDNDPNNKVKSEWFHYTVAHSLLNVPGVRRFQFRDVGFRERGVQKLSVPSLPGPARFPPIFALVGFQLFFIGGQERDLDGIGIFFRGDELNVVFGDGTGDGTFGYLVDFVVIPTHGLNVSTNVFSGTATGRTTVPVPSVPDSDFVLTGWEFNFRHGDHQIRALGVRRGQDDVQIDYRDTGEDDPFTFRIETAQIGRRVIGPGHNLDGLPSAPLASTSTRYATGGGLSPHSWRARGGLLRRGRGRRSRRSKPRRKDTITFAVAGCDRRTACR